MEMRLGLGGRIVAVLVKRVVVVVVMMWTPGPTGWSNTEQIEWWEKRARPQTGNEMNAPSSAKL